MSIEKRIYNNSKTPCERIRQKVYNINITNICNEYMLTLYTYLYLLRYLRLTYWTLWITDDYSVKQSSYIVKHRWIKLKNKGNKKREADMIVNIKMCNMSSM